MPGTLNVGGHNIITHSGTSGAGTINLVDQAGNTILTDSGSGMSLSSNVTFPGKIIKNIYVDSTGTDTTITNSASNKIVYSVSIPNPQTSYSYLIIGGIAGYLDSGGDKLYGSLIKDNGLVTQAYIQDTISFSYALSLSYNDFGFFLNLNYYYEPATNTSFTIDAAVRSNGQTYRAPFIGNRQFMVLELGGN